MYKTNLRRVSAGHPAPAAEGRMEGAMDTKELIRELVTAVVYIVMGALLALNPDMSATLICTGIGVCALAYGAFTLLMYFLRSRDVDSSRLNLPIGIAFAALGVFCLIAPGTVLSIIPLLFGVVLLIDGAGKLGRALELRRVGFVRWGLIACVAAVIMLFGVMLVTRPFVAVNSIMIMFGAMLMADGAIDLYFLFRVYRVWKK